eukprot:1157886-Pelagomonas_calceolata.AAC.2
MPLACHPLLVLAAQLIVASSVAHCLVTAHLEAYIEAYIAAAAAAAASAASAAAPAAKRHHIIYQQSGFKDL